MNWSDCIKAPVNFLETPAASAKKEYPEGQVPSQ
jgi:hypothetical protein